MSSVATGRGLAADRREQEASEAQTRRLIRRTARRLARWPGFTQADREDLEQEFALELLQRRGDHDPERGPWAAFATGVIRHRAIALLREREAGKRGGGTRDLSLDDEVWSEDGERVERAGTLDASDAARRLGTEPLTDREQCELHLDADAILQRLPERLRRLCELLKDMSVAEASRHMGVTRATLRGDLRHIRDHFVASGVATGSLAPSCDPFAY